MSPNGNVCGLGEIMMSEARLADGPKGVIWGVVTASLLVVVVSAHAGDILLTGFVIAAGIFALTWILVGLSVSIAVAEDNIVVRCTAFYSTMIPISDVLAVGTARDTALSDGYGIRILGKNTRGLLVGGPAVFLETTNRRWNISTPDPDRGASAIQRAMGRA